MTTNNVAIKDETQHGGNNHKASAECSMCYLGFEASPVLLRQMIWRMALNFSEEVDATPAELVDQTREEVEEMNIRTAKIQDAINKAKA